MQDTYFYKYRNYHQSIRALCSFCDICIQLMVIVDELHLEGGRNNNNNNVALKCVRHSMST